MSVDLKQALESFGMIVDREPRFDGRPVRYRMNGKRTRSGFMIGREINGKYYAIYGTWEDRTLDQKWSDNGIGTPYCAEQFRGLLASTNQAREDSQATAAEVAATMWAMATEGAHPYLERKKIQAHGCRVLRNLLLVPFYDSSGKLTTVQMIYPGKSGHKMLLTKGRIKGCCSPIQGSETRIYICEGFATGATIHELTGCKVLVAYSTSNLLHVAKEAKDKWPEATIVIAADNDHATPGNPGIKAATAAANAIGAEVAIPECPPGTDFNDMAVERPARATEILTGRSSKISTGEVMRTTYKPIKWAVEGIIPEGLTVLAGRPKFGKSWMMLGLGYAISTGTPAWGYGQTRKGNVYYLALEDSERRIKDRILSMEGYFNTYPENFFIFTNFPKLGQGFTEELSRLLDADTNTGCVIIDTLQKIRPHSGGGKKNLYQSEYEDFETLQKLAISHGVPVIAVHHTRKRSTKGEVLNPMDEISGSSGLQGVADTLIVCVRDGNKGTMHVTGREVDEENYPMEFIRLNMTWKISAPETKQIDVGPMILSEWFRTHETITAKEAAEQFGVNLRTAQRKLKDLIDEGKLVAEKMSNPADPHRYKPAEIF